MHWTEAEELAAEVIGVELDETPIDEIENALLDRYDVSFDQFQRVAESLLPFVCSGARAISGESVRGFGKDGYLIVGLPS